MASGLRYRVLSFIAVLVLLNIVVWLILAGLVAHFAVSALSIGALSYVLGIKHGFDADHIAAIDNVTRKLKQDGQQTLSTGLFFSLGHSTIVILLSLALVAAARLKIGQHSMFRGWGFDVSMAVSAGFLTILGIVNFRIFAQLRKVLRTDKSSSRDALPHASEVETLLNERGLAGKVFSCLYRRIDASWKMFPLGVLFGLGFDTATEIAVLGVSAEAASSGTIPAWAIMAFPLMFAVGMTTVDSMDGALMMGIYDWASSDPKRKLFFNTVITGFSALMALAVAGVEWIQLACVHLRPSGQVWRTIVNLNFSTIGLIMAALMVATWLAAMGFYRRYFSPRYSSQD